MSEVITILGDNVEQVRKLDTNSIDCCVTSPPYYKQRSYLPNNHPLKRFENGQEKTPSDYIKGLVVVFNEVRRVLKLTGTLWVVIDDKVIKGQPAGLPWRFVFAMQEAGWFFVKDIVWCLSGGTLVYTRSGGDKYSVMTLKDLYQRKPASIQLWNGTRWTQLLGVSKTKRTGSELEIVLRSGERISCSPNHRFPTNRGLCEASEIRRGEILQTCRLPEPDHCRDCAIDEDAAWLAGLYLADGSMADDTIQFAGHAREWGRWERLKKIAKKFGGSATMTLDGNNQSIRLYGRVLRAVIAELVRGRTAKDKGFAKTVWRYSNRFIASMLDGYLSGDGHFEKSANRWRLVFTRNYSLEDDLRTACARLGYKLSLRTGFNYFSGTKYPVFRGEIRKTKSTKLNSKNMGEVVEIRKSKCRYVYDVGVMDEPHLFSLASGVLTHNSKPNPTPQSVRKKPTHSHEYIFLFAKTWDYHYDRDAIRTPYAPSTVPRQMRAVSGHHKHINGAPGQSPHSMSQPRPNMREFYNGESTKDYSGANAQNASDTKRRVLASLMKYNGANKKSVWTVPKGSFKGKHFATYPPALIKPCILAGCPKGGIVLDPFGGSGTTAMVAKELGRDAIVIDIHPDYIPIMQERCNLSAK